MTFLPRLYYSPGAVSLVSHIALEELGLAYQLEARSIPKGEHISEDYRRIHPLQRLPALEFAPGQVLTETPAILSYLARLRPELGLVPDALVPRARADEWFSFLASGVHPAFLGFFAPRRYVDDATVEGAVVEAGRKRFFSMLEHAESRVPNEGFLLGPAYTLCDTYLAVIAWWGARFEFPMHELPRVTRIARHVRQRPAAQRALQQEGLLPSA
jgi:glutathione S-transferase